MHKFSKQELFNFIKHDFIYIDDLPLYEDLEKFVANVMISNNPDYKNCTIENMINLSIVMHYLIAISYSEEYFQNFKTLCLECYDA